MKALPLFLCCIVVGQSVARGANDGAVTIIAGPDIHESGFHEPFSVAFDAEGVLYGVEFLKGNRVFRLGKDGVLTFVAGVLSQLTSKGGDVGGDDGDNPLEAHFHGMHDLAITAAGDILLADTFNFRVRVIDGKTGKLSTIAGTGEAGFSGDGGPAEKAKNAGVHSCSLNKDQTKLYMADLGNRRIRVIDLKTNRISTVAGNGEKGTPEDGAVATKAPLAGPRAVTVDDEENIYIVSREGNALRVVDGKGKIRTLVNSGGEKGYSGDGGDDALAARMSGPKHACVDLEGNVIIADTENHAIRKYVPGEGKIYLVAGVPGKKGDVLGKTATETQLARPHGVRVDAEGNLYIADSENDRILKVAAGTW